jgi:predicted 2-oxoglutarate/Fe(II)-dependent dioxygenase YbiX
MTEVAKQLLHALDTLGESAQFCTSGSLSPVLPGLEVKGIGGIGLPISPAQARQLIEKASQAPYGRGEETIVDTEVRRVWQLEPRQFTLTNPEWDSFLAGVVNQISKAFGISKKVASTLYKLLIYEQGSFFVPHRDTEKVDRMFATLVVCLPSRHQGGTLIVSHDGQTQEIDFAGPQGEHKIQYAAFYTDCQHEIKPVTAGYRVCLVYNLALARGKQQPSAPRHTEKSEQVAALLRQLFAEQGLDKLAIPLEHEYTEAGLQPELLKGADNSLLEVLHRAARQLKYDLFLAQMTYQQSGDVDYDTLPYSRWGYDTDAEGVEMGEVYDEELSLDHWIDLEGNKQSFGKMDLLEEEVLTEGGLEDFPVEQEVSEATGNEGVSMERWYRQAMIVLWPRDRYFRLVAKQGQSSGVPLLKRMIAEEKSPSKDPGCLTFAREIINHWKARGYSFSGRESSQSPAMLKLLAKLADPALVDHFIKQVLPRDYEGTEGEPLRKLSDEFGWHTFARGLTQFITSQSPESQTASLKGTVAVVEGLCCGRGPMTPERQGVCKTLGEKLIATITAWDTHKGQQPWYRREESRGEIIESLTHALSAVEATKLLQQFLTRALADKAHYDLHTVLIPAVRKIHQWIGREPVDVAAYEQLRDHCIRELETLTAKPIEFPRDWAQNVTFTCTCADCRNLLAFLRDPVKQVHRMPLAKQRRQHLHQQIDSHGCDLTHITERSGSPFTLVCTKTRASYERKKAQFETDTQLLAELRELTPPSATPPRARKTTTKKKKR